MFGGQAQSELGATGVPYARLSERKEIDMILCFKLSMPNAGSWNGKWSGQNKQYLKIVNLGNSKKSIEKAHKILNRKTPQFASRPEWGSYYYNFGDGWGANF